MKRIHWILLFLFFLTIGTVTIKRLFYPSAPMPLSYSFARIYSKFLSDNYTHAYSIVNSCENWIVVVATRRPDTVINDIKSRTEVSDGVWCCVGVLGTDRNTENMFAKLNTERFIVLSRSDQKELVDSHPGYSSVKNVTSQSYSSLKNLGYLYAIHHGAKLILDAHEDYRLPKGAIPSTDSISEYVVVTSAGDVFNPYKYFYSDPWEVLKLDGLPVEYSWDFKKTNYEMVRENNCTSNRRRVGVMQFLTVHKATPEHYVRQKSNKLPLLMDRATLMPYNSHATLHHYSSFFGLLLPSSPTNAMADALRAYYTQRLMWDINSELAVTKPLIEYTRDTDPAFNSDRENTISSVPDNLITFLQEWKSESKFLAERMEELSRTLDENGFWAEAEVDAIHKWIADLTIAGYKFPLILPPDQETNPKQDCGVPDVRDQAKEHSNKKTVSGKRGKFEVFLRMSTISNDLLTFYEKAFDFSLRFFWQNESSPINLLLVLDDEREKDHTFGREREKLFPFPKLYFEKPNPYYGSNGHSRMQWSMFWADQYATGDYIGFLDTDTLFVTLTSEDLLFEGDKPIVWGLFGKATNWWWAQSKKHNYLFLKEKEVLRAMNYFPVIIKVKHLVEVRNHIERAHGKPFNEVFQKLMPPNFYSQFNIMVTYLWYFHRDEYVWHMEEFRGNQDHDGPDEITNFHDVTEEMRMPYPKFSIHYRYIDGIRVKVEPGFNQKIIDDEPGRKTRNNLMLEGYCYSYGFENTPEMCTKFDVNAVQESLFEFEDHSWGWDSRCITAQQKHFASLADMEHKWNPEILDEISRG